MQGSAISKAFHSPCAHAAVPQDPHLLHALLPGHQQGAAPPAAISSIPGVLLQHSLCAPVGLLANVCSCAALPGLCSGGIVWCSFTGMLAGWPVSLAPSPVALQLLAGWLAGWLVFCPPELDRLSRTGRGGRWGRQARSGCVAKVLPHLEAWCPYWLVLCVFSGQLRRKLLNALWLLAHWLIYWHGGTGRHRGCLGRV